MGILVIVFLFQIYDEVLFHYTNGVLDTLFPGALFPKD